MVSFYSVERFFVVWRFIYGYSGCECEIPCGDEHGVVWVRGHGFGFFKACRSGGALFVGGCVHGAEVASVYGYAYPVVPVCDDVEPVRTSGEAISRRGGYVRRVRIYDLGEYIVAVEPVHTYRKRKANGVSRKTLTGMYRYLLALKRTMTNYTGGIKPSIAMTAIEKKTGEAHMIAAQKTLRGYLVTLAIGEEKAIEKLAEKQHPIAQNKTLIGDILLTPHPIQPNLPHRTTRKTEKNQYHIYRLYCEKQPEKPKCREQR